VFANRQELFRASGAKKADGAATTVTTASSSEGNLAPQPKKEKASKKAN